MYTTAENTLSPIITHIQLRNRKLLYVPETGTTIKARNFIMKWKVHYTLLQ